MRQSSAILSVPPRLAPTAVACGPAPLCIIRPGSTLQGRPCPGCCMQPRRGGPNHDLDATQLPLDPSDSGCNQAPPIESQQAGLHVAGSLRGARGLRQPYKIDQWASKFQGNDNACYTPRLRLGLGFEVGKFIVGVSVGMDYLRWTS